ncbi:PREDICTED: multiple inositol polyphosphate phosphatase 1-like [Cyphomyrmex costatus]|uniref:multiple inositol polyphosphate phosphatase 1-like n=1 Tax=Cyphomyrmex costatus TaxID=456900 RepID=UPI00085245DC|nr:PREDICTED: multiple inositol polyphosphate phosphatase 1-like [Cyphomyrmex costatus]
MYRKLFPIIVICLAKSAVLGNPVSCHSENRSFYPYTGSKTPYSYVHNGTEGTMTLTNCEPTQIWMLVRHGTRYPGESIIAQILNLTHIRNQIITSNVFETCTSQDEKMNLKNWVPYPELVPTKGKYLAVQGEKDLASLAERIRTKLPMFFDCNVTKDFKIRSTATQRTIESMRSFVESAFDINRKKILPMINDTSLHMVKMVRMQQNFTMQYYIPPLEASSNTSIKFEVVPIVNDTLLKLYDSCESWKNRGIDKEVKAFINGPEMAKVIADVNQRLGFLNISKDDIFLFYDACRFERTLYLDKPSPWCDVFTDDEMQVLEYEEDLFYYYNSGPGDKINSQLGCYLIRDIVDHFTKLETNGDEPKGVFYFTHSQMMVLFLTAMGIAQNPMPLTATNFRDMNHRKWRISQLIPFAANFAAIFHRCNSSDAPFKVAFYLNENPLTIEGCDNGVCDWIQLKEKLGIIAANCSMEVCQKIL